MKKPPGVLIVGGGGGVPFLAGALKELEPGVEQAGVNGAIDSGGHSGKLRKEYPGIAPAGDVVKTVGATAEEEEFSLHNMKRRESCGASAGNLMFLERYKQAVEDGEPDPNQVALDRLVRDAGSRAVYFATQPAQLVMRYSGMVVVGEDTIAQRNYRRDEVLDAEFSVEGDDGSDIGPNQVFVDQLRESERIWLAPSHIVHSTLSQLMVLRGLSEEEREEISAKMTLVIGTESPWNMSGLTAADHYRIVQKASGISPAAMAIGQSTVDATEKPEELQQFVDFSHMGLVQRPSENGNPLEDHKPAMLYPGGVVRELLAAA